MAISRSSTSSDPPAWLREVYERRRRRTVRLVELSIASLKQTGAKPSLAALARASKTVDPAEPQGISESAILHNEEAYTLYLQHAPKTRSTQRNTSVERRTNIIEDGQLRVSAGRDRGRARERYLRASKIELVERLLTAEKAYADMENRWMQTADDLLVWIMLVDRLIATTRATGFSR